MKNWKESYKTKICTPDEAIQKIKDTKRISFGHICSESTVLTEALIRNKKLFKKLERLWKNSTSCIRSSAR